MAVLTRDDFLDRHAGYFRKFEGAGFDSIVPVIPFAVPESHDPLRGVEKTSRLHMGVSSA